MTRLSSTRDAAPARARYVQTEVGRLAFQQVDLDGRAMVSVWRPGRASMGLWDLERFGGRLDAAGIRRWVKWATTGQE